MAWTKDSVSGVKRMYNLALGTTLDANGLALANAGNALSTAIQVGVDVALGTIGVTFEVDDSPANNVVVDLYACNTSGGTYAKVADDVATAMTSSTAANAYTAGTVDLTAYPWPFFKICITSTGDESSNHGRIIVSQATGPQGDVDGTSSGIGADPS